jgi:hypothetical protein
MLFRENKRENCAACSDHGWSDEEIGEMQRAVGSIFYDMLMRQYEHEFD